MPSLALPTGPWRWFVVLLFLLIAGVVHATPAFGTPTATPRSPTVVILNAYHLGYQWSDNETQGVLETLRETNPSVEPIVEYLDTKRFPRLDHFPIMADYLRYKYASTTVTLLLTLDNPALEFAIRYRRELFADAPIVFCGINGFEPAMIGSETRVTGVVERLNARDTVRTMLQLHPMTREIVLIHDTSSTGRATRREVESDLQELTKTVNIRYVSGVPIADVAVAIRQLGPTALVGILSYSMDSTGQLFNHSEIASFVATISPVPVYGVHEERLGHGIVGGHLIGGGLHGQQAARMAAQILAGVDPATIPIATAAATRPMFDDTQLRRFGIRATLPPGSIVINAPHSFYEVHWLLVASSVVVFFVLTVLVVALSINIWRRHAAEDQLAKTKNYLDNVVNSMPSFMAGVDPEGRVTLWNRQAEAHTGIRPHEAQGRLIDDLLPQFKSQFALLREAVQERQPRATEKVPAELHGERGFADVLVFPLVANGVTGAVVRIDDVTQRVHIEEMMIQAEKMSSLGGLAAGMAHEINNPLGVIVQGVQNIERRLSPDLPANLQAAAATGVDLHKLKDYLARREIFEFIAGVRNAGSRAAQIVANMLQFSRRSESNRQPARIDELVERALGLATSDYDLRKRYDFKHIEIVREFAADLPPLPITVTEIEQVMLNLLKNAAQAISERPRDESAPPPRIVIRTGREATMARIEVEDNGPGMTESVRRRVFEPFFTTKEPGKGTGLGLSVSYMIITNNHKGQLAVESAPDRGARFVIRLPLAPEDCR